MLLKLPYYLRRLVLDFTTILDASFTKSLCAAAETTFDSVYNVELFVAITCASRLKGTLGIDIEALRTTSATTRTLLLPVAVPIDWFLGIRATDTEMAYRLAEETVPPNIYSNVAVVGFVHKKPLWGKMREYAHCMKLLAKEPLRYVILNDSRQPRYLPPAVYSHSLEAISYDLAVGKEVVDSLEQYVQAPKCVYTRQASNFFRKRKQDACSTESIGDFVVHHNGFANWEGTHAPAAHVKLIGLSVRASALCKHVACRKTFAQLNSVCARPVH